MSAAYAEVILDAHVHYHPGFSRRAFFDAAVNNLGQAARSLGLRQPALTLMFTESAGDNVFASFRDSAGDAAVDGWSFRATGEDNSLWAAPEASMTEDLLIIAGRQLVTRERLEVLALGCADTLPDGMSLREARDATLEAGGVPVVPWGFGKWWFDRGRVVAELIDGASPGRWFVGDNAGRPRLSRAPGLFARAARQGVFVLPGSDPLPLDGQELKTGRCGAVLAGALDADRPAAVVLDRLRQCVEQPPTFGTYEGLTRFARQQVAMQLRKKGDAS